MTLLSLWSMVIPAFTLTHTVVHRAVVVTMQHSEMPGNGIAPTAHPDVAHAVTGASHLLRQEEEAVKNLVAMQREISVEALRARIEAYEATRSATKDTLTRMAAISRELASAQIAQMEFQLKLRASSTDLARFRARSTLSLLSYGVRRDVHRATKASKDLFGRVLAGQVAKYSQLTRLLATPPPHLLIDGLCLAFRLSARTACALERLAFAFVRSVTNIVPVPSTVVTNALAGVHDLLGSSTTEAVPLAGYWYEYVYDEPPTHWRRDPRRWVQQTNWRAEEPTVMATCTCRLPKTVVPAVQACTWLRYMPIFTR